MPKCNQMAIRVHVCAVIQRGLLQARLDYLRDNGRLFRIAKERAQTLQRVQQGAPQVVFDQFHLVVP